MREEPGGGSADAAATGLRRGTSKGFLSVVDAFGVVCDDGDDQSFNMMDEEKRKERKEGGMTSNNYR